MVLGRSIEEYLRNHLNKLRSNYYFTGRGEVECLPENPELGGGSVTKTNGVKIEAVAKHFHFLNSREHYSETVNQFFSYQIRISDDPDYPDLVPC